MEIEVKRDQHIDVILSEDGGTDKVVLDYSS